MSSILELFEVKIRKRGDRITSTGKKVEGGKIVSRHFFRKDADQAESCAKALKIGSVVNIKKVHKEDIIGDLERNKELRKLITRPKTDKEWQLQKKIDNDVIVQDVSISSIIYGSSPEQKEKRSRRLEYNRKHNQEYAEER